MLGFEVLIELGDVGVNAAQHLRRIGAAQSWRLLASIAWIVQRNGDATSGASRVGRTIVID
jgi:hypothetical protein